MERENYYILLELEFEPPENDKDRIKKKIRKKQAEWSSQLNNPNKKREAQSYLDMLKDIETVMLDDTLRSKEAGEAGKAFAKKKYKELDEAIALFSGKGKIFEEQVRGLCKRFSFTEAEVKKRITVPIVAKKSFKKPDDLLNSTLYKNITTGLETVKKKSLYEFLGCDNTADVKTLLSLTKQKADKIRKNSNRDAIHDASLGLTGHCLTVFKSEAEKKKYDASLANQKLEELNKKITTIGGIAKIVGSDDFETLIKEAGKIGMTREEAEEHIMEYCLKNKWTAHPPSRKSRQRQPEKQKKCAICGTKNPVDEKECTSCTTPFEVTCPACGSVTPTTKDRKCVHCKFLLADKHQAPPLIQQAKDNIGRGDQEGAAVLLEKALGYWPNHPEARALLQVIKDEENKIAKLLHKAKEARADGDLKGAAALFKKVLLIRSNHPESLTILDELKEWETGTGRLGTQLNTGKPGLYDGITAAVTGLAGILIAFISAIALSRIIITLLKDKAYTGNGPYIAATIITLFICLAILAWGGRTLFYVYKAIKAPPIPVSPGFQVYGSLEYALTQNQIPPGETALEYVRKKGKTFIKRFLIFIVMVALFFIVKKILPDAFFWTLHLTPKYFTFPLTFTLILAAAAVLMEATIYFHKPAQNLDTAFDKEKRTIRSTAGPDTFAPGIKKSLACIQTGGAANLTYYTGLDSPGKNGKIHGKLFVETHPQPVSFFRPFFIYLYSCAGVILTGLGFLMMTRLPSGNISVLTVPSIAIGYIWTIAKGGLVYAGVSLMKSISRLSRVRGFKSAVVCVDISGDKNQKAYDFNIISTALLTEINTLNGNRQIVKMAVEDESKNAKKTVTNTINAFAV